MFKKIVIITYVCVCVGLSVFVYNFCLSLLISAKVCDNICMLRVAMGVSLVWQPATVLRTWQISLSSHIWRYRLHGGARDDGVTVASAASCANHLHFAADRQSHQHLITQFLTGRMFFLTPNQQC